MSLLGEKCSPSSLEHKDWTEGTLLGHLLPYPSSPTVMWYWDLKTLAVQLAGLQNYIAFLFYGFSVCLDFSIYLYFSVNSSKLAKLGQFFTRRQRRMQTWYSHRALNFFNTESIILWNFLLIHGLQFSANRSKKYGLDTFTWNWGKFIYGYQYIG